MLPFVQKLDNIDRAMFLVILFKTYRTHYIYKDRPVLTFLYLYWSLPLPLSKRRWAISSGEVLSALYYRNLFF